jgi:hypothetical protein
VNTIVTAATGHPAGGGLSVSDMFDALRTSPNYDQVSIDAIHRGDIIISPNGSRRHVSIAASDGGSDLISNSSSAAEVQHNYSIGSWTNYFGTSNTFAFRPRD